MKELLILENELKAIQEEGQKRVSEYEREIETAIQSEEEANREVVRSLGGNDPKAYSKAIEDKRTASNIANYYKGKIEQIKNDPFITENEYIEYTNKIKAEMDNINNKGKTKVNKLLKELEAIQKELVPAYTKTNELLKELQNNIYKFTSEKQMIDSRENGTPLNTNNLHNEYKNNSLINGLDHILKSQIAETIKEGGIE